MKKMKNLLLGAAAVSMLVFSCKKDNNAPLITGLEGNGTYSPGDSVSISSTFTDAEGLASYKMSITTSNGASVKSDEGTLDGTSYSYNYNWVIPSGAAGNTYIVEITVTDDNKDEPLSVTETFEIIVAAANNGIVTYTGKSLADLVSSNSTNNALLSLSTGVAYNSTLSTAQQANVDVVYYYGSTNLNTFAAPTDATLNGGGTNFTLCQNWTTKNATKLEKITSITASQFDAATTDALFAGLTVASSSKVAMLATGDIIAFETAGGKKGLIKITSVPSAAAGSINFDIKIQD